MKSAIKYILERNSIQLRLVIVTGALELRPLHNEWFRESTIRAIVKSEELLANYRLFTVNKDSSHRDVLFYFTQKGWKVVKQTFL